MKKIFIIKSTNGKNPYYIAGWSDGDPARTTIKSSARRFKTMKGARCHRTKIFNRNQHRYKGFNKYEVLKIIKDE